jgi:hypothetical protein
MFANFPSEIIYTILIYTGKFKLRNGKLYSIIPKNDIRYNILQYIPKPLTFSSNSFIYLELQFKNNFENSKKYKIVIDLRNNKYKIITCVVLTIRDQNALYSFNTYNLYNYERL